MSHIRHENLRVGDIVCTTDAKPFSCLTRRVTWGVKSVFDMGCGTHVFIVCDRGSSLFYASEMLPSGLEMGEIHKYDHPIASWLPHICFVGRHPEFEDWAIRETANEYMKDMHSFGVKYGFGELVQFIFKDHPHQYPYKIICSQWATMVFNKVEITNPFGERTSPADWQRWGALKDITAEVLVS